MRVLGRIRDNPIVLLAVAVIALVAWVAVDLMTSAPKKRVGDQAASDDEVPPLVISGHTLRVPPAPIPDDEGVGLGVGLTDAPSIPLAVLPKLKPGMSRAQVETLVGLPAPERIHPVTASDGRLTYRTAYDLAGADLPMTVRPIRPQPRIPQPVQPQALVALEYDASQPGHPLVEVLYSDPLF
jgi:hypothetical protein